MMVLLQLLILEIVDFGVPIHDQRGGRQGLQIKGAGGTLPTRTEGRGGSGGDGGITVGGGDNGAVGY